MSVCIIVHLQPVYLKAFHIRVTTVQMACLLPAFKWPFSAKTLPPSSSTTFKPHFRNLLFIFPILSLFTTLYRLPQSPPHPFKSGPRILNAGIWTVHFGIDNEGHDSQRGMRNLIRSVSFLLLLNISSYPHFSRDMELDIVGLLETDLHVCIFATKIY